MNIKIKKTSTQNGSISDNYFMVYIDGVPKKAVCFKLNEPKDSIFNEETAKKEAMAYIETVEAEVASGIQSLEEIVYEHEIGLKETVK